MAATLRTLAWAACLPLLWPPGVCPHHGPADLLTRLLSDHHPAPADDGEPCCPECHGADQSRLVEPAADAGVDRPAVGEWVVAVRPAARPSASRPAPPPHPSPPLYLTHCALVI